MRKSAEELITDQIAVEIRKLNSIITDEDEKPAIVQRIADLKATLDSSDETIEDKPEIAPFTIGDVISAFRRR